MLKNIVQSSIDYSLCDVILPSARMRSEGPPVCPCPNPACSKLIRSTNDTAYIMGWDFYSETAPLHAQYARAPRVCTLVYSYVLLIVQRILFLAPRRICKSQGNVMCKELNIAK